MNIIHQNQKDDFHGRQTEKQDLSPPPEKQELPLSAEKQASLPAPQISEV